MPSGNCLPFPRWLVVQLHSHDRVKDSIDWGNTEIADSYRITHSCSQFDMNAGVDTMYLRVLEGYEKAWGAEHASMLDTVNNLGLLYAHQVKMAEAEAMYVRALQGYKKA